MPSPDLDGNRKLEQASVNRPSIWFAHKDGNVLPRVCRSLIWQWPKVNILCYPVKLFRTPQASESAFNVTLAAFPSRDFLIMHNSGTPNGTPEKQIPLGVEVPLPDPDEPGQAQLRSI